MHNFVVILCSCLTCIHLTPQVCSPPCTHSSHASLADLVNTPKADERAIMTYVSCYYHAFQGAQQVNHSRVPLTEPFAEPFHIILSSHHSREPLLCPYNKLILRHSRGFIPQHGHTPASQPQPHTGCSHTFFSTCSKISSLPVS